MAQNGIGKTRKVLISYKQTAKPPSVADPHVPVNRDRCDPAHSDPPDMIPHHSTLGQSVNRACRDPGHSDPGFFPCKIRAGGTVGIVFAIQRGQNGDMHKVCQACPWHSFCKGSACDRSHKFTLDKKKPATNGRLPLQ